MILLQDSQITQKGIEAFEKLSNPILIILLLVLIAFIVIMYRYFKSVIKERDSIIEKKEAIIASYTASILEIYKSDAILINELKGTLDKLASADKSYAEKLGHINDLLQQLLAKIDSLLKK